MGEEEEEEEEEGDSEGKDIDYSNMLAVDITEQVRWQQSFETLSNTQKKGLESGKGTIYVY